MKQNVVWVLKKPEHKCHIVGKIVALSENSQTVSKMPHCRKKLPHCLKIATFACLRFVVFSDRPLSTSPLCFSLNKEAVFLQDVNRIRDNVSFLQADWKACEEMRCVLSGVRRTDCAGVFGVFDGVCSILPIIRMMFFSSSSSPMPCRLLTPPINSGSSDVKPRPFTLHTSMCFRRRSSQSSSPSRREVS